MVQEYLYEIIAVIVILIVLMIYFLTKNSEQKSMNDLLNPQEDINKQDNELTNDNPTLDDTDKENPKTIQENSFKENIKIKKNYRVKGTVPEHGKITKENFKEFAGVKLLIAEDNLINQKVLKSLLSDSGIKLEIADDGQFALDILEKNNDFDIILMDAHMPRVDGFEASKIIRSNPNYEHIVIVALSGDSAPDDVKKMLDAGMQEHLEKPLKIEALYDILYAYTKTNTNNKSEFVEIIMTKELNGDKGLEVCGGDEEFYINILCEFTKNYTDSVDKIYKYIQDNNFSDADAMLLDFIGITANIGADNINNIAQELKKAIKDRKTEKYSSLISEYEKHLNLLLKDIEDYKTFSI